MFPRNERLVAVPQNGGVEFARIFEILDAISELNEFVVRGHTNTISEFLSDEQKVFAEEI